MFSKLDQLYWFCRNLCDELIRDECRRRCITEGYVGSDDELNECIEECISNKAEDHEDLDCIENLFQKLKDMKIKCKKCGNEQYMLNLLEHLITTIDYNKVPEAEIKLEITCPKCKNREIIITQIDLKNF